MKTAASVRPRLILILVILFVLFGLALTAIQADEGSSVAGESVPPAPTSGAVGPNNFHPLVRNDPTTAP